MAQVGRVHFCVFAGLNHPTNIVGHSPLLSQPGISESGKAFVGCERIRLVAIEI